MPGHTVKICGLRDAPSALVAAAAGTTAIGFILAPSRRRVNPAAVREILSCLPNDAGRPLAVGVVVNESAATMRRLIDETGLNLVQLAGDEEPSILNDLAVRTWKVMRFSFGSDVEAARRSMDPWFDHPRPAEAVLIDASVPGRYGGSGHVADWTLAAELARQYPVILAGGLTPENVAAAIDVVRPRGVDVSSGVETKGAKDPVRIREFVTAAAAAFASNPDA